MPAPTPRRGSARSSSSRTRCSGSSRSTNRHAGSPSTSARSTAGCARTSSRPRRPRSSTSGCPTAGGGARRSRRRSGLKPVLEGARIEVEGGFGRHRWSRARRTARCSRRRASRLRARPAIEDAGLVGGGSDANTTSLYTATLDGLGPVGEGSSPRRGRVVAVQLPEHTALLALLLLEGRELGSRSRGPDARDSEVRACVAEINEGGFRWVLSRTMTVGGCRIGCGLGSSRCCRAPRASAGCHRPRVPDRDAMDAILLVLRTGMQWNALNATGICSSSWAPSAFREWERVGVFHEILAARSARLRRAGRSSWAWLSCDGATGKAPLGGEAEPSRIPRMEQRGAKRSLLCEQRGVPIGLAPRRRQPPRLKAPSRDASTRCRSSGPDRQPTLPGPLSRRRLRLPVGLQLAAGRGYTAHVRRRSDELELKRIVPGWRARRSGRRSVPLLAQPQPRPPDPLIEETQNHLALLQLACGLIAFKKAHAARLAHALPR